MAKTPLISWADKPIRTMVATPASTGLPVQVVTLGSLSVSPNLATVGTAFSAMVSGKAQGSSLALSGAGAAGLSITGTTISGTPTAVGSIDIIETLAGATGSPKTSSGVATTQAAPIVLGALSVSPSSATVGTAFNGTISGKTAGSSLALSGAGAAGLSITGTTISGTPTTAGPINIVETLAGATGSPKTSAGVVTAQAAPVVLGALSVSPSSATVGTAFNGSVTGKTAGSTLALSGAGAAGLSITDTTISGTPTASGAVDIVETLAGASNSPKTTSSVVTAASADPIISRLAGRIYGPGHNGSAAAPLTGDGTLKSASFTQVNDTGAPITDIDFAFQGWTLSINGPVNNGTAFTVDAAQIEYPVGTVIGTVGATVVPDGGVVASTKITLSTPIPTGATYKVTPSSTVPNGGKYIANLGFAGIRSYAPKSTLKKVALAVIGCDSIATNNSGSFYTAALGRCSAYQNSIIGTKAATFGANAAAKFLPMLAVAAFLGLTDVVANVQTNDMTDALATIQGNLTAMRDAARTAGLKYNQCTCMPVTKLITPPTVSSLTSSGTTLTAVVSDATKYTVGNLYKVAGATPADYNVYARCTAVNTGTNTVTFLFAGSGSSSATGTITIVPWAATAESSWLLPSTANYGPGDSSQRGQLNAWTRSGVFDGFIEWSDACELVRNSSLWKVAGDDALLPSPQSVTVSSVIVANTRFNSDYSRGNSTAPLGYAIALMGANAGQVRSLNGNTGGDITLASALPNAIAVGDQFYIATGASYMSTDHLHPVVSAGPNFGGQSHIDQVSIAWLTAKLAA